MSARDSGRGRRPGRAASARRPTPCSASSRDFRGLLGPGDAPHEWRDSRSRLSTARAATTSGRDPARSTASAATSSTSSAQAGLAQLVVTLGDVRGKGVGAAARAIMAKYLIRAMLAAQRWPLLPGEALRDVHNALLAVPHEPHDFVTVCIASVDARSGTVGLATAGHPSPIVAAPRPHRAAAAVRQPGARRHRRGRASGAAHRLRRAGPRRRPAALHRRALRRARRRRPLLRRRAPRPGPRGVARPAGRRAPAGPDRRRHRVRRASAGRRRRPRSRPAHVRRRPASAVVGRSAAAFTERDTEGL